MNINAWFWFTKTVISYGSPNELFLGSSKTKVQLLWKIVDCFCLPFTDPSFVSFTGGPHTKGHWRYYRWTQSGPSSTTWAQVHIKFSLFLSYNTLHVSSLFHFMHSMPPMLEQPAIFLSNGGWISHIRNLNKLNQSLTKFKLNHKQLPLWQFAWS